MTKYAHDCSGTITWTFYLRFPSKSTTESQELASRPTTQQHNELERVEAAAAAGKNQGSRGSRHGTSQGPGIFFCSLFNTILMYDSRVCLQWENDTYTPQQEVSH